MNKKNCIQLEMNFEGSFGNRLKDRLDNGEFQIFAEISAPSAETRPEDAAQRYSDFEYVTLSRTTHPTALAFLDMDGGACSLMDPVAFADCICKSSRDSHLLYASGRNKSRAQVFGMVKHAIAEGFKNFCLVSGYTGAEENIQSVSKILFTESSDSIRTLRESCDGSVLTGGVINPFQYTAQGVYTQYFHLVKKIASGASFIVTQFGWDMKKLQEMRWNLFRRFLEIPSFARILFMTPELAEKACSGKIPGVRISPDLENVLAEEMRQGASQFQAAQQRRIQLHAIGAKLLGFSGIQLGGIENPELLDRILSKIDDAFEEFQSFEDWLSVYKEYFGRLEMAPYPYRFYMFEGLLNSCYPDENLRMREAPLEICTRSERFRYRLSKCLFSHADELPPSEKLLTKKMLASCKSCERCRLPQTMFVCPEECPKGLANGPCGEPLPSGKCPFMPEKDCIYALRMRLAQTYNNYSSLEETVIPSLDERRR